MLAASHLTRLRRKLGQIARSDLTIFGKASYAFDLALESLRGPSRTGVRRYALAGGASIVLREHSTDRKVFDEIFLENTYTGFAASRTADAPILIDLGANIGLSAIALARQLRARGIVAVEPDAGNFALLGENLRRAGLSAHSKAIRAFAGAERGFAELIDSGNGAWGMRMGAPARAGIPVWRIEDLVAVADHLFGNADRRPGDSAHTPPVILKCDIEGAEAQLFHSLSRWEHLVDRVILELHTEFFSAESLRASLDASHYSWRIEGEIAPDAVLAVITLERGELKTIPQTQHAAVS